MPTFKTLWDNYPDAEQIKQICFHKRTHDGNDGTEPFDNYCSILMSECLIRSGVTVQGCSGVKCWSHAGARHVIQAEQLAKCLRKSPPSGFGKAENILSSNFQERLSGRTGVVFFKDYWSRGAETFANRSGDHIDLWNKNRITGSSMWYRSLMEFLGLISDLNKSREIWFWEVN